MTIISDFPIFKNRPLVYLDSAATSLKPQQVIDAIVSYYTTIGATVHRGIYKSSVEATGLYENVRIKVCTFIGGNSPSEVIFVRNTTEAINLVAYAWGEENIGRGDEIVTTIMEHHSNFLPWQELAKRKKARLLSARINDKGLLDIDHLKSLLSSKTKLVALTHVSNVLGTINPIKEIVELAQEVGAKVLVDGAQAVPHMPVNVNRLGCDFYAFSGHKMLGPTGIGVLWVKREVGQKMRPFLYGGGMIREVGLKGAKYDGMPLKFEAGTPHIDGVIGLGEAVKYLEKVGMDKVRKHEEELVGYGVREIRKIRGVGGVGEVGGIRVWGPEDIVNRGGVVSFTVDGIHPHDLASVLDADNIAIRAGHHCCMPLHAALGVPATARASFYIYNSQKDVDLLVAGLKKAKDIFK